MLTIEEYNYKLKLKAHKRRFVCSGIYLNQKAKKQAVKRQLLKKHTKKQLIKKRLIQSLKQKLKRKLTIVNLPINYVLE